jgi:hypothetical protein
MFAVGRTPNPLHGRIGLAGGRPLAVRFTEIRDRALKEIPPSDPDFSCINLMMSESSIDLIYEALERSAARRAPPEVPPALRQAWNEISAAQRNYNKRVTDLKELQQKVLWRAQTDWKHALLRSFNADMWTLPPPMNTDWVGSELYPDIVSAKAAQKTILAQLQSIEKLVDQVANAAGFDSLEPGEQALHLSRALFEDYTALVNRVVQLEAQLKSRKATPTKRKV